MKLTGLLLIIFTLIGFASRGQNYEGPLTSPHKSNFQTVKDAIHYLKTEKTNSITSFDSSSIRVLTKQYNKFLEKFFDVAYMADPARKSIMTLESQLLLIYNIDHYLDIVPLDSVFISPIAHFDPKEAESDLDHTLITYYKIGGRIFNVQSILFNNDGKIKGIAPFIDFHRNHKGIDIEGFYKRNGYDQIKDKLYRF